MTAQPSRPGLAKTKPVHTPTEPQVYGCHYSQMRLRWTCPRCAKRNDSKLSQPYQATELFACMHCRRVATFKLTEAPKPEGGTP
jgi:hypothetical protein